VAVRVRSMTPAVVTYNVHVKGGADVGVPGHGGDVGGIEFPGEQGGGAQHVPQAVPGPRAVAAGVAPAGSRVGGG